MPRLTSIPLLTLALSAAALGQPAVLEGDVLSIENGVVLGEDANLFYKDIRLQVQPDGQFSLLTAEPRNLAIVEEVEVLILESFPVQVRVQVDGYLRMACLDLEEPAVRRVDDGFEIWLAETPLDPLALCAQVIEPFSVSVPLDTEGLSSGEYAVRVNGVEAYFVLPGSV